MSNMVKPYHSRLRDLLSRWTTPPAPAGDNEIGYWQDKLLFTLLLATLIFGVPVYVASVALCIKEEFWSVAVVDTAIYGWVIALFFRRTLPFVIRASSFVYMSYALGMILLLTVGPFGAGPVWIFAFPVLAAVFMGVGTVLLSLAINAITLIADWNTACERHPWVGLPYHQFKSKMGGDRPEFHASERHCRHFGFLYFKRAADLPETKKRDAGYAGTEA